jgi:hypothetical protein
MQAFKISGFSRGGLGGIKAVPEGPIDLMGLFQDPEGSCSLRERLDTLQRTAANPRSENPDLGHPAMS